MTMPMAASEAATATTAAINARGELVRIQATTPNAIDRTRPSKKPVKIHCISRFPTTYLLYPHEEGARTSIRTPPLQADLNLHDYAAFCLPSSARGGGSLR